MPETTKPKKLTKKEEEFIAEIESLGQARKAVYEYLLSQEFQLTEARHKELKKLLNSAVRAETNQLVREKAELSAKLDQKFTVQANEVFRALRDVNFNQFKRSFKPKQQGVLQIVIKRLHQYLEAGKGQADESNL